MPVCSASIASPSTTGSASTAPTSSRKVQRSVEVLYGSTRSIVKTLYARRARPRSAAADPIPCRAGIACAHARLRGSHRARASRRCDRRTGEVMNPMHQTRVNPSTELRMQRRCARRSCDMKDGMRDESAATGLARRGPMQIVITSLMTCAPRRAFAAAGQSHELQAKERSMIRIYLVISALVTLFGCVANDESSAQLGSWSANATADCDPNLPLCECTLKGSPACADPDNDGVPNMDDNCRDTFNPGQENCDGDA